MAEIVFKHLDGLLLDMQTVAQLPESVIDEMLNAGADVLLPAHKREAEKLGRPGGYRDSKQRKKYATGGTARSIEKEEPRDARGKHKGGRVLYIIPSGSRHRGKTATRNAEIAFINEYGTRAISPRPFMDTANRKSESAVNEAEFRVWDKWLESKNL